MKVEVCTFLALIFIVIFASSAVQAVSAFGVVGTVTVGWLPVSVAYDSGKGEIFATNNDYGTVSVISDSNNTVVATIPVGDNPGGLAYDPAKGEIFESDLNLVYIISDSNNTVIATIPVGFGGGGPIVYDSGKGEVFLDNWANGRSGSYRISVIVWLQRYLLDSVPQN